MAESLLRLDTEFSTSSSVDKSCEKKTTTALITSCSQDAEIEKGPIFRV